MRPAGIATSEGAKADGAVRIRHRTAQRKAEPNRAVQQKSEQPRKMDENGSNTHQRVLVPVEAVGLADVVAAVVRRAHVLHVRVLCSKAQPGNQKER